MSNQSTLMASTRAEWIKFRSVRSTIMGVIVTVVLTIGLGILIDSVTRSHWNQINGIRQAIFDPTSRSLAGNFFAQFAVGVIGTLFISSEYTSGSIRTTLTAVPNRFRLIASKLIVLIGSLFIVTEIVCFAAFLIGQRIFLGVVPTASLTNTDVLRSVILSGVYLTLLAVIGFALGLILRQSAASISVFVSLLLIIPLIVIFLPQSWQNSFSKFELSTLGQSMSAPSRAADTFGAWTSLAVLLVYVVILVGVAMTLFERRDAGAGQ